MLSPCPGGCHLLTEVRWSTAAVTTSQPTVPSLLCSQAPQSQTAEVLMSR